MSNVINFRNTVMTRNEKLTVLLWSFFETHDVQPEDALEILGAMTDEIKEATEQ